MGLVVDNFAGGGGASSGIEAALGRPIDYAINHDAQAIAMHRVNHPRTHHLISSVWDVNPTRLCAGRAVDLAWFSPDCTFHSKARGGKPFRDRDTARRRRGLAGLIPRWMAAVGPDVVMLENVEEFADWGPLDKEGRPDPLRRGSSFRRWIRQIENLGYSVDLRELKAHEYGAPTTRKRLFIICRRDGREIVFPAATHGPGLAPFRTAAECIDWSIPCPSIFERTRELADATKRRIARGVMRYVVNNRHPFIVTLRGTSDAHIEASARDMLDPLRTISAHGNHHALVTPFLTEHANASTLRNFSAGEPLRTQCAEVKGGHFALVSPVIVGCGGRMGQSPERSLDRPMQTITSKGDACLVSAMVARHYGGHENDGHPLDQSLSTVTAKDHHALVAASLMKYYGTDQDPRLDGPLGTVTTKDRFAMVQAFLLRFYGQSKEAGLTAPLDTVTTRDRFGLVTVHGEQYRIVDIGMRMLAPRELFIAQGFRDDYIIDHGLDADGARLPLTKTAQVRMCGNSVSPKVAEALVRANVVDQREQVAA
jgi:DNA (cytosine-5)-methyltransferase 1